MPRVVKPPAEREYDWLSWAVMNQRRAVPFRQLGEQQLVRYDQGNGFETFNGGYALTKVCVCIHYYSDQSGLEWHRLAQHAEHGCFGVFETGADRVAEQWLMREHGVMYFVPYAEFVDTTVEIVDCIKRYPIEFAQRQQRVHAWWMYELQAFEHVLEAYWSVGERIREDDTITEYVRL